MQNTAPFEAIETRAIDARLTINDLVDLAGIKRITYWRARNDRHKRADTVTKILRKLEGALDKIEAERISTARK